VRRHPNLLRKKGTLGIANIIVVAGAESAIGLGILVAFYRLNSSFKLSPYFLAPGASSKNIYPYSKVRFFSTGNASPKCNVNTIFLKAQALDSSFITGLIDAEGSFVVTILKNPRYKIG